jgi:Ran GTPase-activating protein (RanGAP) involved in mRNA processing and transport
MRRSTKEQLKLVKVSNLIEVKGHKMVYVITDMHPETISKIDISDVAKIARKHLGEQLKKWTRRKELYINDVL